MRRSTTRQKKSNQFLKIAENESKRCRYKLPEQKSEIEYHCPFVIEGNVSEDYCVFHIYKPLEDVMSQMDSDDLAQAIAIEAEFSVGISKIIENAKEDERDCIDFRGFHFPKISFDKAFPKKVDFSYSVFNCVADFATQIENPNPEHAYDNTRALLLEKGAIFNNVTFKENAIFKAVQVFADIDFQNSVFEKDALIENASFTESTSFNEVKFNGLADFNNTNFKNVSFDNAVVSGKFEFYTTSTETISFWNTIFNQEVTFDGGSFGRQKSENEQNKVESLEYEQNEETEGYATFVGTIFNEKVSFSGSGFFCPAEFYDVIFRKRVEFLCYLDNHAPFDGLGIFDNGLNFTGVTLPEDEECVFLRTNLSKARFHDTNLEKIVFRDVEWAKPTTKSQKLLRGNSYLLWDEIRPITGMRDWLDDAKTAENYSQLVLNYEECVLRDNLNTNYAGKNLPHFWCKSLNSKRPLPTI